MGDDDKEGLDGVDVVPSPDGDGDGDAYSAPTRVGQISSVQVAEMMQAAETQTAALDARAAKSQGESRGAASSFDSAAREVDDEDDYAAVTKLGPLAKLPSSERQDSTDGEPAESAPASVPARADRGSPASVPARADRGSPVSAPARAGRGSPESSVVHGVVRQLSPATVAAIAVAVVAALVAGAYMMSR